MIQHIYHCPTKDIEVNFQVELIPSRTLEDLSPKYAIGRYHCSNLQQCGTCDFYKSLPQNLSE